MLCGLAQPGICAKAYDTYITLGRKKSAVRGEIETRKRISFICEPRTLVQACRERKEEGIALVFREVVAGDNAVIDYRLFELSALFFRPSFFFEGFEHQNWTLKRPSFFIPTPSLNPCRL
ncbi:hypothetical protein CDAR_287621 [Caerostris darwini]|uniref:Uncharacterized protein n=1 Tax=Caerostris darwini TaxID=1538125 RepID=A0AAV4NFC5_9ARAC|nr:hypothetical protein CDAR_287621 [Caerostris darwini]